MVTPMGERTMKNTTRIVAIAAVSVAVLGSAVAAASLAWHGRHNEKFLRRMVDAHVEEELDELNATPAQRQQVSAIEDKLFADFKVSREARHGFLQTLTDQFAQPQLDSAALDQAFQPVAQSHEMLRTEMLQAVGEVHDLLTPDQRVKLVARVKQLEEHFGR
jgi:Spy/CpxP family protein refolding chaperone